ncbi:MAG: alpha/beta fold hydrolase [Alphaproteobacteria bacterium]|jgi:pimeloyl-ACP methyl ester carboxylesterase|nr:alpha/beta fold hydrolase [Alphaproteobacteria bacterium]
MGQTLRRLLAILLTLVAILAAGWLALRRPDIPFDTLEVAYANADSQFAVAGEHERIHYRVHGPPDAPALVLVHGFSASLHTWTPWVRRLESDYRIVTLDLPGHGLTRGFDPDEAGVDLFIESIHTIADTAGLETFTLAGSSMGGHAAWNYALEHPERLDGLVLIAASGWPRSQEEKQSRPLIFRLLENRFARAILRDLDMSSMIRSGLEDSFADPSRVTDAMVERYSALSRAPGHRETLLRLSTASTREPARQEQLARLDLPVLVMQGDRDNLVPPRHGQEFAGAIPDAELAWYENVGHLPHEEIPRRSAADLKGFLETRIVSQAAGDTAGDSPAAAGTGNGIQP